MFKRLFVVAATAMLAFGVAIAGAQSSSEGAQAGPPGAGHMRGQQMSPEQQLDHLSKALNLTDDQKSQVKTILEDRQKQMESLRSDSSLSPDDRRSKARSFMQDSHTKLRAVLTDEQKAKFDEMQSRMREHRGPPGGAPNAPNSPPPNN
jgi:Spy/CpxP family protein refolding chaperone